MKYESVQTELVLTSLNITVTQSMLGLAEQTYKKKEKKEEEAGFELLNGGKQFTP